MKLSHHANQQIEARGVVTAQEVIQVVTQIEPAIRTTRRGEVRVIIKVLPTLVACPDGSNGDTIIACVDPRNLTVKTVMLQRSSQVERKRQVQTNEYIYL